MVDPLDQAMAFQLPERLRQHFLGDSIDQPQQLVVADGAFRQERNDEQHPLAGNDFQHATGRAFGTVDISTRLLRAGLRIHGNQKVRTCR